MLAMYWHEFFNASLRIDVKLYSDLQHKETWVLVTVIMKWYILQLFFKSWKINKKAPGPRVCFSWSYDLQPYCVTYSVHFFYFKIWHRNTGLINTSQLNITNYNYMNMNINCKYARSNKFSRQSDRDFLITNMS